MRKFSRRIFLGGLIAVGAGAVASPSAHADPVSGRVLLRQPTEPPLLSANGWPIEAQPDREGGVWTRIITGPSLSVPLRVGAVTQVLGHVVRRYHYEIAELLVGDVVGFVPTGAASGRESNHASGTAVDIRPGWYPVGTREGMSGREVETIRSILADCRGVVAWGGDGPAFDVAHFDIAVLPNDPTLEILAADLRVLSDTPADRPGALATDT